MAIFKCKMCGGNLEVNEKSTVGTCQYCGSTMTLPKDSDEKKANLFNRANHYRRNNDFDKAMATYENILNEDNNDAEAHWGVVLCKYGIEYVEDPKTKKRIPTCHRAQYGSILADEDYKQALANADDQARTLYEQEAKAIEGIQKQILEISAKEEPFDVFICYKETSETGSRTKDSVIAQDIYYHLTEAGYKVFFSRITLEDKLGTAYEPYIFAALNSSKVMVVVGTKPEHFNATWTKNEWSRYLSLIKGGAKKILIPAYKDMDPYDLPEEFSHLQAQDMSKIGFVQDLTRGIKKVVSEKEKSAVVVTPTAGSVPASNVNALLDRAFMALEDGEFEKAEEMLEQVLNNDSRNAQAYIGKLMVELEVNVQKELSEESDPLEYSKNYEKALRFADKETAAYLVGVNQAILDRNQADENESDYIMAKRLLSTGDHKGAIKAFSTLGTYKDSQDLVLEAKQREFNQNIRELERIIHERTQSNYILTLKQIRESFLELGDFSNSAEKVHQFDKVIWQEVIYQDCILTLNRNGAVEGLEKTKETLAGIGEYRNSAGLLNEIDQKTTTIHRKEKGNKILKVVIPALIAFFLAYYFFLSPIIQYNKAKSLVDQQKFGEAYVSYTSLGSFKDSEQQANTLLPEFKKQQKEMMKNAQRKAIAAGGDYTVGLKSDGTVLAVGDDHCDQLNVRAWRDIVAIEKGSCHTVGLKSDGTVLAEGDDDSGQLNVRGWRDIVAIAAGNFHTIGLKSDGTVLAVGTDGTWEWEATGQLNVSDWRDIVAIAGGWSHTVGLNSYGTVVAVGDNGDGQLNVLGWTDILAIAAGDHHTVGLKSDGTVVAVGDNLYGQLDVADWRDIVAIAAGDQQTVGLKADGTVVAAGESITGYKIDVSGWRDIVAVAAGREHTVGLKSDGTVVAVGSNYYGQLNVEDWRGIFLPLLPVGSHIK